jgi:hypothetical protein
LTRSLALLLVGCGPEYGMTWHGDVAFTAEERAKIESGNAWIAEKMHQEAYEIVWDAPHPAEGSPGRVRDIVRRPDSVGGLHSGDGGTIYLGLQGNPLDVLAAHEFGHTRLMDHHPGGVMDPNPTTLAWTLEDEAEAETIR